MSDKAEAETWRKERMYGVNPDEVLWALVSGSTPETFRVVGSTIREADADSILAARVAQQQLAQAERSLRMIVNLLGPSVPRDLPEGADTEWGEALNEAIAALDRSRTETGAP